MEFYRTSVNGFSNAIFGLRRSLELKDSESYFYDYVNIGIYKDFTVRSEYFELCQDDIELLKCCYRDLNLNFLDTINVTFYLKANMSWWHYINKIKSVDYHYCNYIISDMVNLSYLELIKLFSLLTNDNSFVKNNMVDYGKFCYWLSCLPLMSDIIKGVYYTSLPDLSKCYYL